MNEQIEGKVKWYSENSSYGFITGSDNIDYFFHKDDLKNLQLEILDEVTFRPLKTKRDWRAKNIALLKKAEKNSNFITCPGCKATITPQLITEEKKSNKLTFIKEVKKSFICPHCDHNLGIYEIEKKSDDIIASLLVSIICVALLTALVVYNLNI